MVRKDHGLTTSADSPEEVAAEVDKPVHEYAEAPIEDLNHPSENTINHGVSPSGLEMNAVHGDKATGINYMSLIKKVVCHIGGSRAGKPSKIRIH